jgi:succinate dehydrogenase / fumarate reductase cytochrome b subunit
VAAEGVVARVRATAAMAGGGLKGSRMARVLTFYRTSVGKKAVMAVTGLIWWGYVIVHVLGNLQIFAGAAQLNAYAAFLKANPGLLWSVRLVLLAAFVLHVVAAIQLTRQSLGSRPEKYRYKDVIQADYAALTMRWSGPIIAVFVVYHLLHFTTGTLHPQFNAHDVYGNVVSGFRVWPVAIFYILAMVALGFHLWHGVWSLFQTLGLVNPKTDALFRRVAMVATLAIVLGFIAIPVAVLAGLLS